MRAWIEPSERPVPEEVLDLVGGNQLVAQVLVRRGYADRAGTLAFLDPNYYQPASPYELPGMNRAVERLLGAVERREEILVWGDFDVDGQTATALLVQSLRELGAVVGYHVPVRSLESHGVSQRVLQRLIEGPGKPISVVLTCDTGISAHEAISYAQQRGVDVIVTDHHQIPVRRPSLTDGSGREEPGIWLPPAFAVVTPRLLPGPHPLINLPGVGVAYKLAEALYSESGGREGAEKLLDLAALGIVADVAMQTGDTRYQLQRGLELLRKGERTGLQAIYERAGIIPEHLTEEHIGFMLAPRLNAMGRLADANPAVELLTTGDIGLARRMALELEGLNARRQLLTSQVLHGVLAQLEQDRTLNEDPALVLSHPSWEAGVVGIVASRLVELFGKPAALISVSPDGHGRGSARSIPGIDITAAIGSQAGLLSGFGGHAMAAGFSLDARNIPAFRSGLLQWISRQMIGYEEEQIALQIDGFMEWQDLDLELAEAIDRLAPFGSGNPPVMLASRGLHLLDRTHFGPQNEHLQLIVENNEGLARRVVWWGGGDLNTEDLVPDDRFDLAYTIRPAMYRDQKDFSIQFEDFRIEKQAIDLVSEAPSREILDYRGQKAPLQILAQLLREFDLETIQIWAEGESQSRLKESLENIGLPITPTLIGGRDRLRQCERLVIWTAPPGPFELRSGLGITRPSRLLVFGINPGAEQLQDFLRRLAGLAKYILKVQEGKARLISLASATGQTESTTRLGLEWLEANGNFWIQAAEQNRSSTILADESDVVDLVLIPGGSSDPDRAASLHDQLQIQLEETAAFREYFRRINLGEWIE